MSIGDAILLDTPPKDLADALDAANIRLATHDDLEAQRVANGCETDLERYLRGAEISD